MNLDGMETRRGQCAYCNNDMVTTCDKTNANICRKHACVIPVSEKVSPSLIQVVAKKYVPKKHKDKLEELAKKRGVKFDL